MKLLVSVLLSFFLVNGYAMTPEEIGEADIIKSAPCMYNKTVALCVLAVLDGKLYGVTFDHKGIVEILELPSLKSLWKRKLQM